VKINFVLVIYFCVFNKQRNTSCQLSAHISFAISLIIVDTRPVFS